MTDKPLKIVNASAGSGKTYTLVQEYLRLVLHDKNPKKYRSILAMTFTNKAANEMKTRILDALIQLARPEYEKSESDFKFLSDTAKELNMAPRVIEERAQKILNQVLHNYSSFAVMTIDKFTHRIIRTFARDLNISPDFDVELDIKTMRRNVTDLLFEQIGRNDELTHLMMRYARTNLNQDKTWNFSEQVFEFSDLLFKEDAIRAIGLLKKLSSEDFLQVQNELQEENAKIRNALKRNATEALDLAVSRGLSDDDFVGKSSGILSFFRRIQREDFKKPSDTAYKNVAANSWAHPSSPNRPAVEQIAPLLTQYFNQIDDLLTNGTQQLILNREILRNINNLSLLNHLLTLVEGIKEEQNVLLISDFYKKISEIIIDEKIPFVYERMGTRYEHFLLDEFQDTSQLQWISMIPLLHNSLAAGHENLIVGDGKQAIYRWRNGEVEQFTNLPDRIYNPENIPSLRDAEKQFADSGSLTVLKKNYRSAPELVEFNNQLFSELSQSLAQSIQYIYATAHQQSVLKHRGYIEARMMDARNDEEQLKYVENAIARALEKGFQWKDICVLVRKNDKGAMIADYLTSKGTKVISPDSLMIGKERGVRFIFNLMCSAAIPSERNHKIKTLEYYSMLILKEEPSLLIEREREKLNTKTIEEIFADLGTPLISYTKFDNLYEYAFYLVNEFELDLLFNPYLQFFLEGIHLFEQRNNSNIRDFMDWFNSRGNSQSIVSPEGSNAVQVMTIHKAKGLEFPVVICPFFDWKFELQKQISWVEKKDEKLPAFFVKMSKDLKETNLNNVFQNEESKFYLDQLNLMYVAFTRAKSALFICANSKTPLTPASHWLKPYFAKQTWDYLNDETCFTGSLEYPHTSEKKSINAFVIDRSYDRLPKPKMSFRSGENWNVDDLDEKRAFGTRLHLVLSKLNSKGDLKMVLDALTLKGRIELEHREALEKEIQRLFDDKKFAAYFDQPAWNEKPIITSDGRKLIPDKIIPGSDAMLVVDFKTGQPSDAHLEQVLEYVWKLKEITGKPVRAEIYYTDKNEIVPVN